MTTPTFREMLAVHLARELSLSGMLVDPSTPVPTITLIQADGDGDVPHWCTVCNAIRHVGRHVGKRCQAEHPDALHRLYFFPTEADAPTVPTIQAIDERLTCVEAAIAHHRLGPAAS